MKHSSFLLLGICLLPFGCAPKEEMAADKPLGKRKVSYIRFLNLSSQSSSAKVDSVETYPSVEPESLTGGTVIGQQTQKIEFGSADKPTKGETKPLAGTFLTVVKDNTGTLKFINSGECESFDSGAKVEIANFTSKAVECEFEKKQFKVEPGTSATTATLSGSNSVTPKGMKPIEFQMLEKEIWTVYFYEMNGKVKAQAVRTKGPMKMIGAGASPPG